MMISVRTQGRKDIYFYGPVLLVVLLFSYFLAHCFFTLYEVSTCTVQYVCTAVDSNFPCLFTSVRVEAENPFTPPPPPAHPLVPRAGYRRRAAALLLRGHRGEQRLGWQGILYEHQAFRTYERPLVDKDLVVYSFIISIQRFSISSRI